MSTKNTILNIIDIAKQNKWPYPQTFQALKNAGVNSYDVSWQNGYKAVYACESDTIEEPELENFNQPEISDTFSASAAKQSLGRHQQGKTNYLEWLYEMAKAGVAQYYVNMDKRNVTYYNLNKTAFIIESIPDQSTTE